MPSLKSRFLAAGEETQRALYRSSYEALRKQLRPFVECLPGNLERAVAHLEERVDKSLRDPAPGSLKRDIIVGMSLGEIGTVELPEIVKLCEYCAQPDINSAVKIQVSYLEKPTQTGDFVKVTVSVDPYENFSGPEYSCEPPKSGAVIKQITRPWTVQA